MDMLVLILVPLAVVLLGLLIVLVVWRVGRQTPPEAGRRDSTAEGGLMGDSQGGQSLDALNQTPELPMLHIPDSIKDNLPEGAELIFAPPDGLQMRPVNEDDPGGLQFIMVPVPGMPGFEEAGAETQPPNGHAAQHPRPSDADDETRR